VKEYVNDDLQQLFMLQILWDLEFVLRGLAKIHYGIQQAGRQGLDSTRLAHSFCHSREKTIGLACLFVLGPKVLRYLLLFSKVVYCYFSKLQQHSMTGDRFDDPPESKESGDEDVFDGLLEEAEIDGGNDEPKFSPPVHTLVAHFGGGGSLKGEKAKQARQTREDFDEFDSFVMDRRTKSFRGELERSEKSLKSEDDYGLTFATGYEADDSLVEAKDVRPRRPSVGERRRLVSQGKKVYPSSANQVADILVKKEKESPHKAVFIKKAKKDIPYDEPTDPPEGKDSRDRYQDTKSASEDDIEDESKDETTSFVSQDESTLASLSVVELRKTRELKKAIAQCSDEQDEGLSYLVEICKRGGTSVEQFIEALRQDLEADQFVQEVEELSQEAARQGQETVGVMQNIDFTDMNPCDLAELLKGYDFTALLNSLNTFNSDGSAQELKTQSAADPEESEVKESQSLEVDLLEIEMEQSAAEQVQDRETEDKETRVPPMQGETSTIEVVAVDKDTGDKEIIEEPIQEEKPTTEPLFGKAVETTTELMQETESSTESDEEEELTAVLRQEFGSKAEPTREFDSKAEPSHEMDSKAEPLQEEGPTQTYDMLSIDLGKRDDQGFLPVKEEQAPMQGDYPVHMSRSLSHIPDGRRSLWLPPVQEEPTVMQGENRKHMSRSVSHNPDGRRSPWWLRERPANLSRSVSQNLDIRSRWFTNGYDQLKEDSEMGQEVSEIWSEAYDQKPEEAGLSGLTNRVDNEHEVTKISEDVPEAPEAPESPVKEGVESPDKEIPAKHGPASVGPKPEEVGLSGLTDRVDNALEMTEIGEEVPAEETKSAGEEVPEKMSVSFGPKPEELGLKNKEDQEQEVIEMGEEVPAEEAPYMHCKALVSREDPVGLLQSSLSSCFPDLHNMNCSDLVNNDQGFEAVYLKEEGAAPPGPQKKKHSSMFSKLFYGSKKVKSDKLRLLPPAGELDLVRVTLEDGSAALVRKKLFYGSKKVKHGKLKEVAVKEDSEVVRVRLGDGSTAMMRKAIAKKARQIEWI